MSDYKETSDTLKRSKSISMPMVVIISYITFTIGSCGPDLHKKEFGEQVAQMLTVQQSETLRSNNCELRGLTNVCQGLEIGIIKQKAFTKAKQLRLAREAKYEAEEQIRIKNCAKASELKNIETYCSKEEVLQKLALTQ